MSQPGEAEIAEAKKRGKEKHLTKNYNFAGPGTFYKARMKGGDYYENLMKAAGRKLVGTKPYNKPYDKLDGCGKVHDKVYADPKATSEQIKAADREFQKCAQKVTLKDDGITDKLRSIAARVGFEGKIALEEAGIFSKGSYAAGGETTKEHLTRVGKGIGRFLMGATGAYLGLKGGQAIANKGTKTK